MAERAQREGPATLTRPPPEALGPVPSLDGLRGLAVAAVLAFHHGFAWARGGFLGVSTFFTLSGFLITTRMLGEWRTTGRVDLTDFWVRRVRRLLPAALLCLTGVVLAARLVPGAPGVLPGDAIAALAQVANWRAVAVGASYVDVFTSPGPLQHFWSLAIEAQFYAVFPMVLVGALAAGRRPLRVAAVVVAALLASSAAAAVAVHTPGDTRLVYYATHTRAAELLAGALLAVALASRGRRRGIAEAGRADRVIAALGAIALAASVAAWATVTLGSTFLWEGGMVLYAAASVAVVAAARVPGPVRAVLMVPALRALGRVSYGVYLFHWPVYLWLSQRRLGGSSPSLFAARVAVTLVLAVLSYRLVELPVRTGSGRWSRVSRRAAPAFAALVVVLAPVAGPRGALDPQRVARPEVPPIQLADAAVPGDAGIHPTSTGEWTARDGAEIRRVLFVGDSLLGWGFEEIRAVFADAGITTVYAGGPGTGPLNPQGSWRAQVDAWVDAFDPDVVVFEACCNYVRTPSPDTNPDAPEPFRASNGSVVEAGSESLYREWFREARELSRRAARRGALVVWALSPPMETNGWYGPLEAHVARLNRLYCSLGLPLVDWSSAVAVGGGFGWEMPVGEGRSEVIRADDGVHLAPAGSRLVARLTLYEIRRHAGESWRGSGRSRSGLVEAG